MNILKSGIIYLIVLAVVLASSRAGEAQQLPVDNQGNFKQDLLDMRKKYDQVDRIHVVMHVKVFDNVSSSNAFYNQRFEIQKDKENYRYQLGEMDMLMNDKFIVIIDNTQREIMCNRRDVKGEKIYKDPVKANLDSLFSFFSTPVYVGMQNDIAHYQLSISDGDVTEVHVFINKRKMIFERITYQYRDKQFAAIDFKVFDVQPQFALDTFSEATYVTLSKTKIKPSAKFAGYHILNGEAGN
jgi:hypothetical protein